jgi:hypothetical protein
MYSFSYLQNKLSSPGGHLYRAFPLSKVSSARGLSGSIQLKLPTLPDDRRPTGRSHLSETAVGRMQFLTRARDRTNLPLMIYPGNTKGGSITVLLTSCLTGLESAV